MSKNDQDEAQIIDTILRSTDGRRKLTDSEAAMIVRRHRNLVDTYNAPTLDAANDPVTRALSQLGAPADREALSQLVRLRRLRRPEPTGPTTFLNAALPTSLTVPVPGSIIVDTPPYLTGGPLVEQTGADAIDVQDGIAPADAPPVSSAGPRGKTFSALALPATGDLSLGVGLGTIRTIPTIRSVYPPSEEFRGAVAALQFLGERTMATGTLVNLTIPVPRAPLLSQTDLSVSVAVTIGNSQPFYLVDFPPPEALPLIRMQAFGSAHLVLTSSSGRVAQTTFQFLNHDQTEAQPGTPTIVRQFRLGQTMTLAVGTVWVSAAVEVRLTLHRIFTTNFGTPSLNDRAGFAIIDLRSPVVPTHHIHSILDPGGPIHVSQIALTFGAGEVVAQSA